MKRHFKEFIKGKRVPKDHNDEEKLTRFFFRFKAWYCKNIARWGTGGPKGVTKVIFRKWIEKYNKSIQRSLSKNVEIKVK
jgi:hypothetical protein